MIGSIHKWRHQFAQFLTLSSIVNGIYLDIVGAHLGWKMLWKGEASQLGRFVFLFTLMGARSFSPTSEFTDSSIEAKCEPVKKYKRACENCASKPVKSLYRVGRYCDMAVSPTRSHWLCFPLPFHNFLHLHVGICHSFFLNF